MLVTRRVLPLELGPHAICRAVPEAEEDEEESDEEAESAVAATESSAEAEGTPALASLPSTHAPSKKKARTDDGPTFSAGPTAPLTAVNPTVSDLTAARPLLPAVTAPAVQGNTASNGAPWIAAAMSQNGHGGIRPGSSALPSQWNASLQDVAQSLQAQLLQPRQQQQHGSTAQQGGSTASKQHQPLAHAAQPLQEGGSSELLDDPFAGMAAAKHADSWTRPPAGQQQPLQAIQVQQTHSSALADLSGMQTQPWLKPTDAQQQPLHPFQMQHTASSAPVSQGQLAAHVNGYLTQEMGSGLASDFVSSALQSLTNLHELQNALSTHHQTLLAMLQNVQGKTSNVYRQKMALLAAAQQMKAAAGACGQPALQTLTAAFQSQLQQAQQLCQTEIKFLTETCASVQMRILR